MLYCLASRESARACAESSVCLCVLEEAPPTVYSEHLPFISQGRRVHGRWVPDSWAQLVRYRIMYYSYIMALQVKEISLLDSLACSWSSPFSMSRRCLVGTAPGVARGVACHVAERPCSLRRRRHDGKVPCRRFQLIQQTGSARVRCRRLHCVPW